MGIPENKEERIGGVLLDFSHYPGEDFYCDGAVEGEILELAKEHEPSEFPALIQEKKSWEVLYHLSPVRGNIVRWIPFTGKEKVLEIGAGPGAITSALAVEAAQVECVELSAMRSRINAWRNKDRDNVTIHVGNFTDIEPSLPADYDYILLIGVLEYAQVYLDKGEDSFREEITRLLPHLKPGGRLVIAIENRLGLKYFAGCREDHTGRYFDSIENYADAQLAVHTFSKPALEKLFASCGIKDAHFYYPYPDYKFPGSIYSEERLPDASELTDNIRNFDRDRLLLFDEKKAYDGLTEDGLFPLFSNSFAAVIGPALPVEYCKFSNDRAEEFQIYTQLRIGADGRREIVKKPATPAADGHVRRMEESCRRLQARYAGGKLQITDCRIEEGERPAAVFPYVTGRPLEAMLDACLVQGDEEGFRSLLREFYERTGYHDENDFADYDMTFQNILVDGDTWTAIDYEWVREGQMSAGELLFRALYCYCLEKEERSELPLEELLADFSITPAQIEEWKLKEPAFQEYVSGGRTPLGELRAQIGGDVTIPAELIRENPALLEEELARAEKEEEQKEEEPCLSSVQVYYDRGEGFSEADSFFLKEHYEEEGLIRFTLEIPGDVRSLRIDPAICPCVAMVRRIDREGESCRELLKKPRHNGIAAAGGVLFTTSDPWFMWNLSKEQKKAGRNGENGTLKLYFELQMAGLPSTMAQALSE